MGFAVWLTGDIVWASGTHEYRPMGTAVVARSGQLRARDFARYRRSPDRRSPDFVGFFGSLEEVNQFLARNPKSFRLGTAKGRSRSSQLLG